MKTPRRPRFYDVTTNPRAGESPPPSPVALSRRSLRASLREALGAVSLWLRRPVVLLVPGILALGLAAKVVADRFRPPTVDGPALAMAGWRASGYPSAGRPGAALDRDAQTRWITASSQRASCWFAVDMGKPRTFHQVVMDAGANSDDWPRGYTVYVSPDGAHWGSAVAVGAGRSPLIIVDLGPRTARGIKVVLTDRVSDHPWSLAEFTVH